MSLTYEEIPKVHRVPSKFLLKESSKKICDYREPFTFLTAWL